MAVLAGATTLGLVPRDRPVRCHQLRADRDEQFAVDLVHPYRLVFEPDHDPIPRTADGGIDLDSVTSIAIVGVIDYH
jgi:proteic killer suppression protein